MPRARREPGVSEMCRVLMRSEDESSGHSAHRRRGSHSSDQREKQHGDASGAAAPQRASRERKREKQSEREREKRGAGAGDGGGGQSRDSYLYNAAEREGLPTGSKWRIFFFAPASKMGKKPWIG